ncbi:chitin-binding protein, partial [Streptomyces uncialis]
MRKKMYAAMLGIATVGAVTLSSGGASSHGYTDQPL